MRPRPPIEIVEIQPGVSASNPPIQLALPAPACSPPASPERFSPEQEGDLDALDEAAGCWVRKRLLVALAIAAEPVDVAALAARAGIDPNTASHHLSILRHGGFVRGRQQGKQVYYTAVPSRVRVDRSGGALSLTLTHPSGAYRTIGVPRGATQQAPASGTVATEPVLSLSKDGARTDTD